VLPIGEEATDNDHLCRVETQMTRKITRLGEKRGKKRTRFELSCHTECLDLKPSFPTYYSRRENPETFK